MEYVNKRLKKINLFYQKVIDFGKYRAIYYIVVTQTHRRRKNYGL